MEQLLTKYKVGDKLICIPITEDKEIKGIYERDNNPRYGGAGWEEKKVGTISKITLDTPVPIYWAPEWKDRGVYEDCLELLEVYNSPGYVKPEHSLQSVIQKIVQELRSQ